MLALAHGHHRAVAVHVLVDGGLDVAYGKAMAEPESGVALGVCGHEVQAVKLGGVGSVALDVLLEVGALLFLFPRRARLRYAAL